MEVESEEEEAAAAENAREDEMVECGSDSRNAAGRQKDPGELNIDFI